MSNESILDRVKRERVFEIEREGNNFIVREMCDEYFDIYLTPEDLEKLGQEIIHLAKTSPIPSNLELDILKARITHYEKEIRELKGRENARNLAELKFTHQGPPEGYVPPKPEIPQNLRLPEDGGAPKPVRPENITITESDPIVEMWRAMIEKIKEINNNLK